jgi:hypothetical protein
MSHVAGATVSDASWKTRQVAPAVANTPEELEHFLDNLKLPIKDVYKVLAPRRPSACKCLPLSVSISAHQFREPGASSCSKIDGCVPHTRLPQPSHARVCSEDVGAVFHGSLD